MRRFHRRAKKARGLRAQISSEDSATFAGKFCCSSKSSAPDAGIEQEAAMDSARTELKDNVEKLRNAKKAAATPEASKRDVADLKILEQEVQAQRLQMKRDAGKDEPAIVTPKPGESPEKVLDRKLDAALKESFPGSDPVSFVQAAPVKPQDEELTSVKGGTNKG
jgi:hypothetical protein